MSKGRKKQFGRVGVLYGGTSSERDISLLSGRAVFDALEKSGLDVVAIDIGARPIDAIRAAGLDRAFIALHGSLGEDGTLQGALELLGLPYTGSGVMASALAMDKLRTKQLWLGVGLATPRYLLLDASTDWEWAIATLERSAIVKPAREGSSVGMTRVESPNELEAAWREAYQFDSSVIAEQWIDGAEYTVAILGNTVLPPIRLETDRRFYDYEAKYLADDTRYLCPCGLEGARLRELGELSLAAFNSLGCSGWGRVDVMADREGRFYLLEVNTVPGMTSHSLVPMAAAAAGLDFQQLVLRILETTLEDR